MKLTKAKLRDVLIANMPKLTIAHFDGKNTSMLEVASISFNGPFVQIGTFEFEEHRDVVKRAAVNLLCKPQVNKKVKK